MAMKKTIPLSKARVGMYVESVGRNWLKHDFLRNSFEVDEAALAKLKASKLKQIIIDTDKGLDVAEAPASPEPSEPKPEAPAKPLFPETTGADIAQAKKAYSLAADTVRNLMNDARSGKELKPEQAEDSAEQLIKSIDRSPQTLNAVTRIKTRDEYTFQHSVGVAALLAGFAGEDHSAAQIEEITIGGIVHDIGKIHVPDSILNKPDKLTDEEFVLMKKHVTFSREIFAEHNNFTEMQTDIALLHHERPDGRGYPLGLKDGQISRIGYMGAVIDVYDALSTKRVYKEAWEPSVALKRMVEWGPGQFDRDTLMRFIRYLGVYPVGTWVELDSKQVGFVLSLNENKLKPVVQLKLALRDRRLINETLDLSGNTDDFISNVVSPADFGLEDDFAV